MASTARPPGASSRALPPAPSLDRAPLVLAERTGPVAVLTLNNPPLNILTTPLLDELRDRVTQITADLRVRALVITGSGDRAFSAGANVQEMLPMTRREAARHSAKGQALFNLLERAPIPVIAAVRGFCVGGGCEMVQACDFIIAGDDALFGQPEINIGVCPGWGGSRRLTRTIGPVRARRWIMTGDRVGAAAALQDGFLDRVVSPTEVLSAAVELGTSLAQKPADALAATKYLVNVAADPGRREGLEYERRLWSLLFETAGQREGMRAFLEKRTAAFPAGRTPRSATSQFSWATSTPRRRKRPARRTRLRR